MDAGLIVQYVLVALAVMVSLAFVANKQFPDGVRRLRIAFAVPLVRPGRSAWVQRIGRRLAPPARLADAACGGCSQGSSCDTSHS